MSQSEELHSRELYRRGLSRVQLERLFGHQRWLNSGGRAGKQLVSVYKFGAPGKSFIRHDLDGVDLSQAVIGGIAFSRSTLRHARFVGSEISNVLFYGCDVQGADFSGAKLKNVEFKETNYELACFDGADIEQVSWNREDRPHLNAARIPTRCPKL